MVDIAKTIEKIAENAGTQGESLSDKYKISDTTKAPWENNERAEFDKPFGKDTADNPFAISESSEPPWKQRDSGSFGKIDGPKPSYIDNGENNTTNAESETKTGNDSNESGEQEKINPEEYLTGEQIDTIRQKYKELGYSDQEIEAKTQEYAQKAKACKEAEEKGLDNLDSKQKGNYGEMKTDLDMLDKGYVRISKDSITSLDDKGHKGIDGVYEDPAGKPQFFIIDSKYGSSQLTETKDGMQMSDEWIDNRLDEAVGKEKADEIRSESIENPDNVGKAIAHIDSEGKVEYTDVDDLESGDINNE
jgi:hypothetical protein